MAQLHTEEGWERRRQAMDQLVEKIDGYGIGLKRGILKNLPINACMADSGNAVTIAPTGEIGLCDHYSDSEFIGHIDEEHFDQKMVDSWREIAQGMPECLSCCFYPECIRLKKCNTGSSCHYVSRHLIFSRTHHQMRNEYENWKNQAHVENTDESDEC